MKVCQYDLLFYISIMPKKVIWWRLNGLTMSDAIQIGDCRDIHTCHIPLDISTMSIHFRKDNNRYTTQLFIDVYFLLVISVDRSEDALVDTWKYQKRKGFFSLSLTRHNKLTVLSFSLSITTWLFAFFSTRYEKLYSPIILHVHNQ